MDPQNITQPWVTLYRSALLELDYKKLPGLLTRAGSAIQERLDAISGQPDQTAEIRSLHDALQNLRVLQKEVKDSTDLPEEIESASHHHSELQGEYVVFVDANRRYIEVSDGVCRLLGYSRDELLRKTIEDISAPELTPTVEKKFEEYVSQGAMEGEYALMARDGRRIPIRYWSRVFPDGCMVASWTPLSRN